MVNKEFKAVTVKILSKATDQQLSVIRSMIGREREKRLATAEKKYFTKKPVGTK